MFADVTRVNLRSACTTGCASGSDWFSYRSCLSFTMNTCHGPTFLTRSWSRRSGSSTASRKYWARFLSWELSSLAAPSNAQALDRPGGPARCWQLRGPPCCRSTGWNWSPRRLLMRSRWTEDWDQQGRHRLGWSRLLRVVELFEPVGHLVRNRLPQLKMIPELIRALRNLSGLSQNITFVTRLKVL